MLQRLFARNASEERIEDAVERGTAVEARDALRERSAVILERLAKRQAAVREQEIKDRQDARQAAEDAAEQARQDTVSAQAELQAETATTDTPEASTAPAEAVLAEQATDMQAAPVHDEAAPDMEADVHSRTEPTAQAEPGFVEAAHDAEDMPQAPEQGYFSEEAPLRDEPEMRAGIPDDVADRETDFHDGHAEQETAPAADDEDAPAASPASEMLDDPEVYEQIRQKAEAAKARIAARLQQMEAGEQSDTDEAGHRLDLGTDTPPLSPELDD